MDRVAVLGSTRALSPWPTECRSQSAPLSRMQRERAERQPMASASSTRLTDRLGLTLVFSKLAP